MSARRRARWAAVALSVSGVLAACGVPVEERAVEIPERRLPFGLGAESGTTVAARPTTTVPAALAPGRVSVRRVPLSFSYGDDIVSIVRELDEPVDLEGVLALLAQGPLPGEVPAGARSAVEPGDVVDVALRRGVATVTLGPGFRDLPAGEQRRAVHQITLTLTALPGIGQVTHVVGDTAFVVPRLDGSPALVVSRDDFAPLVLTKIVTTTTPSGRPTASAMP